MSGPSESGQRNDIVSQETQSDIALALANVSIEIMRLMKLPDLSSREVYRSCFFITPDPIEWLQARRVHRILKYLVKVCGIIYSGVPGFF